MGASVFSPPIICFPNKDDKDNVTCELCLFLRGCPFSPFIVERFFCRSIFIYLPMPLARLLLCLAGRERPPYLLPVRVSLRVWEPYLAKDSVFLGHQFRRG